MGEHKVLELFCPGAVSIRGGTVSLWTGQFQRSQISNPCTMVRECAGLQCEITECGQGGTDAELDSVGLASLARLGSFVHVHPSIWYLQLYWLNLVLVRATMGLC